MNCISKKKAEDKETFNKYESETILKDYILRHFGDS